MSRFKKSPKLDQNFIYPYSDDNEQKRKEIWSNLQKGILLEDTQTFINWETPFNQLDNFKEKRRDSGDRTEWYFGNRKILDGFECHVESMMWMYLPWTNSFERITVNLGFGKDGHQIFLQLINHLRNILGEPTNTEIEYENENFTEGSYEWENNGVKINVHGFDMHGARYHLNIGLVRNSNEEYLDNAIEELKVSGLTEEELGK